MATEQQMRELLLDLANEAYMRQDYRCNKRICDLLGVPSAIDHEMADSRPKPVVMAEWPKPDPEYDYRPQSSKLGPVANSEWDASGMYRGSY